MVAEIRLLEIQSPPSVSLLMIELFVVVFSFRITTNSRCWRLDLAILSFANYEAMVHNYIDYSANFDDAYPWLLGGELLFPSKYFHSNKQINF